MSKLVLVLVAALLAGCGSTPPEPVSETESAEKAAEKAAEEIEALEKEVEDFEKKAEEAEEAEKKAEDAEEEAEKAEEEVEALVSDDEIADLAMELTWSAMSTADQEAVCQGWLFDESAMIDAFMGSADQGGETTITREQVRSFFDNEC